MPAHLVRVRKDDRGQLWRQCMGPKCRGEVWHPWDANHFHHTKRNYQEGLQYWCKACMCHQNLISNAKRAQRHRDRRSFLLERACVIADTESDVGVALQLILVER